MNEKRGDIGTIVTVQEETSFRALRLASSFEYVAHLLSLIHLPNYLLTAMPFHSLIPRTPKCLFLWQIALPCLAWLLPFLPELMAVKARP